MHTKVHSGLHYYSNLPETFERLAWKFISYIPKGYHRVDLLADCYFKNLIKDAERSKRGTSKKVLVKSSKSKIPGEFSSKFLSCGDNKTRMIELLFETIENERDEVLETLRSEEIVLSREGECKKITSSEIQPFDRLLSTQEEADTKVIAHAVEFLDQDSDLNVVIRSPSGDTDIIVLCVSLLHLNKERVIIDNGSGKARKSIWLGSLNISPRRCEVLLGLHVSEEMIMFLRSSRKVKMRAGS